MRADILFTDSISEISLIYFKILSKFYLIEKLFDLIKYDETFQNDVLGLIVFLFNQFNVKNKMLNKIKKIYRVDKSVKSYKTNLVDIYIYTINSYQMTKESEQVFTSVKEVE